MKVEMSLRGVPGIAAEAERLAHGPAGARRHQTADRAKARFEAVAANIVSAINADDPEAFSKDFNAEMWQALPLSAARQFLAKIQSSAGKVLSRGEPV